MFSPLKTTAVIIKPMLLSRNTCRTFFLIAITGLFSFSLYAQKLSSFQHYTFLSDFPQNSIQSLYQDKTGYLWIGTESGLNKYDGRRIINYKMGYNDNFYLSSKRINQITADDKGNLWIATSLGGINIISPHESPEKNSRLKVLSDSINKKIASDFTPCLKILKNKTVVIAADTGICIYNPVNNHIQRIRSFYYQKQEIRCDIIKIEETGNGDILLASSTAGVLLLDQNFTVKQYWDSPLFDQGENLQIIDILPVSPGSIFIATASGLYKLYLNHTNSLKRLNDQDSITLSSLRVNCLAFDRLNNQILAGTNNTGVITLDTNGIITDHLADNFNVQRLHSNTIYSLLIAPNNAGYWIGTRNGLSKFFREEDKFGGYKLQTPEDGSPLSVYPIYTEDNENVLLGTAKSLVLVNLKTGVKTDLPSPTGQTLRFNAICKVSDNLYLFGTREGLYYSSSYTNPVLEKLSLKHTELRAFDKFNILCILPLDNNTILIGSKEDNTGGLIQWDRIKKTVTHFVNVPGNPSSLPSNTINFLNRSAGREIVVCTNKGLCYFDPSSSSFTPLPAKSNNTINYKQVMFALSKNKTLWIATYGGGLNKYDQATGKIDYITEKEGLSNNDIYTIYSDNAGYLWMSTNGGLISFNTQTGKVRNYDKADGLLNNEFNRTSSFKLGDTLYFGGISGINYFNCNTFNESKSVPIADIPRVTVLRQGKEENQFPDNSGKLVLSYKSNTLKFYFSSPYYVNPGKTTFYYRLLPEQTEWINNGTTDELIISQLQPGHYTLEVRTMSSEGIQSSNVKSIFIYITPPWYQTWWFKALLVLAIIAAAYSLYRMRINQLKKEDKIRNQLASDLHDDLGSTLNSVKVYSNLAMMEKENLGHLIKIKESTQDAIAGVRDLIWVLDDKKDTIQDLLTRVKQFAGPLCEANQVQFIQTIESGLYQFNLGKEEKKNLYMILKESINNSIKYAGCRQIELKIWQEGKKIRLSLHDDGRGFDAEKIKEGNGLRNIRNRAREIGYKSSINSSADKGTTILLVKT